MLPLQVPADGVPALGILIWILIATVSARTAAIAFNRLVDAGMDVQNARAAERQLCLPDKNDDKVSKPSSPCCHNGNSSYAMAIMAHLAVSHFRIAN